MDSYNQIYNSSIYGNTKLFSDVCSVFSDKSLLIYFLKVEVALSKVQGDLGIIPKEASIKIQEVANSGFLDMNTFLSQTAIVGFPIVALTEQLSKASGSHGKFVHWGATTQDIMDTALMLQLKDTLKLFEYELVKIIEAMLNLTSSYRKTIMVGRSQMQHGLPITFGFKVALWLSPILNHYEQIKKIQNELLYVQFGGAVGTLASLESNGLKIRKSLASELGLIEPKISWHSSREVLIDIMHRVTSLSGTLGKVGKDLSLLSQTEIGEVKEQQIAHRGVSSTMPQKRNPISSQGLVISAKNTSNCMSLIYETLLNDHERGTGIWQLEWIAIPNLIQHASGGIGLANELLEHLQVHPEIMQINFLKTNGFVMSEAVMMALAKKIGKQKAHDLVHEFIEQAQKENKTFKEVIEQNEIASQYSKKDIASWLNPQNYLGSTQFMIDEIIEKAENLINNEI